MIETLIKAGANPNAARDEKWQYRADAGGPHRENRTIKVLLDNGAAINAGRTGPAPAR